MKIENAGLDMRKEKTHILVVSQYFFPEQFRINDICVEWVKRGYKVTVLTGIPNYPQGEYYEGYDLNHKRTEVWNGVKVVRIPLIPRGQSSIGLALNYMSFVVSGFVWNLITKIKADYVFNFEVSPMTQSLIGVWYAKKRNIPCYLYVQDLWPENVEIVTGIRSPFVLNPISKMVNYIYRNSTHIFATSPSFVKEIQKRCENKDKVSYWPQYAEDFYQPVEIEEARKRVTEIPDDGSFKIIFTGNIGQAQGLEILPKAAKILKREIFLQTNEKPSSYVRFIIVGDGRNRENFQREIVECGVADMFVLVGRKPAERIPELLACCDAAFLSFMDNELFTKTIPAKLQSYMACGMPILAAASGESERVIREAECGGCSAIGDAHALVNEIKKMLKTASDEQKSMGINARNYYVEFFDKRKLMENIQEFFV